MYRPILHTALVALISIPGLALAEEADLSMALLEERAIARYPEIEAAAAEVEGFEAQLREVSWRPFSGVSVSGTLSPTPERRGDAAHSAYGDIYLGDTWGVLFRLQLRLSLPLITFGRLQADREAVRRDLAASSGRAAEVRRRTRNRVQRAWTALQLARQSMSLLEEGESYLSRANRYVEGAIGDEDGGITESDQLQLQVVGAEVDARLSDARRAIRLAAAALRFLADLPEGTEIETPPLEPRTVELGTLESYINTALEVRPDVASAGEMTEAADARRRSARAGFFPELRLTGYLDYAVSNVVDDQLNPFVSDSFNYLRYGVGLQMSWGLDFMSDRARLHQAEARLRRASADEASARTLASLEVEEAFIAVEESRAIVDARRRGRRASRGWLVSVMQGIDVGVLDPPELVDALRAYFEQSFLSLEAISRLNASITHLAIVTSDGGPTSTFVRESELDE